MFDTGACGLGVFTSYQLSGLTRHGLIHSRREDPLVVISFQGLRPLLNSRIIPSVACPETFICTISAFSFQL